MERQALRSDREVQRPGDWQMVVTAEEINGWLAVELPKKFPACPAAGHGQIPAWRSGPRGSCWPAGISRAVCESVLSLSIVPYVPEPGVLALRIGQRGPGCFRCRWTGVLKGDTQGRQGCRPRPAMEMAAGRRRPGAADYAAGHAGQTSQALSASRACNSARAKSASRATEPRGGGKGVAWAAGRSPSYVQAKLPLVGRAGQPAEGCPAADPAAGKLDRQFRLALLPAKVSAPVPGGHAAAAAGDRAPRNRE